jgi:hypothetical protein
MVQVSDFVLFSVFDYPQWLNQNPGSTIFNVHSGHFIQLDHPKLICQQLNRIVEIADKILRVNSLNDQHERQSGPHPP